jgi:hypothetical protein
MSRFMLSQSSNVVAGMVWLAYAALAGVVVFGAGYGVARLAGVAAGVLLAVLLTVIAGWFAPPLLLRAGRLIQERLKRRQGARW